MLQLSRNDLRRERRFACRAFATEPPDVNVLLRRFRTIVPYDGATVHRIGPTGIARWASPIMRRVVRQGRLSVSEAVAGDLVHLSIWRRTGEFSRADHPSRRADGP